MVLCRNFLFSHEICSSFRPPFAWSSTGPVPNWDFGGSTVVTDGYIRITPDRQSRRGWLWNRNPAQMKAWEIEVEFKVHGQGRHTYGDGFAIWYTKESMQQGTYNFVWWADTYGATIYRSCVR
jgi:mannose-binding lectin 2